MKFPNLTRCLAFAAVTMSMASCSTDSGDYTYEPPQVAYGVVANASPDSGDLYFFADDNAVNVNGLNYTDAEGYYSFSPGERVLKIKDETGEVLATDTLTLTVGQVFSTFAVNRFEEIELVTFQDSLEYPATNKARVRFINLTADAPEIMIYKNSQTIATLPFKGSSDYMDVEVDALENYVFKLAGSEQTLYTMTNGNLEVGRIYTIYTKGYVYPPAASNDTFSAETIRNY
ncbi:DUF4397 domain-containing protein [Flavobacterium silvaticum]|uniref:DUF4397 domain-containing protein n=1 Tax=Flavobacterium silvaticum TaxID=1852020 RepID=A0A972JH24_9FLAO|nr:DUF4397 domain-containing protein [Flavobacterium silvaticum]NMH29654.1 DUF4397 domain-containing protein [Flavobacterium silvaticum]